MVIYELIEDNEDEYIYEYYPEGNTDDKGIISYSKADGSINIVKLAKCDEYRKYAFKCLKGIRKGVKRASVAWY